MPKAGNLRCARTRQRNKVAKAMLSLEFRVVLVLCFVGLLLAFYLTPDIHFCGW